MIDKRVNKYQNDYDKIDIDDKKNIAKDVIEFADKENIAIDKDENRVKHLIDTDIRENIPPQMYQVICNIVEMIEELEK